MNSERKKRVIDFGISNQNLELFFNSRYSIYFVTIWATLEAFIWFVIPEFLLLLIIFMRTRKKIALLLFDIVGTSIGTIVASLLSYTFSPSNNTLTHIPYITTSMINQVTFWYQKFGLIGLFFHPFSGIPYKVFTLTVSRFDFNIFLFCLLAILVRISRYYIFYLIFSFLYPLFHKFVSKNYIGLSMVACFVFTISLLRVVAIYNR